MRRLLLSPLLVLFVLLPLACGGDDTPAGLPQDTDLQALVACSAEGLAHVALAVETSRILFHELEDQAYTPPAEFGYIAEVGAFRYEWDLGYAGGVPTEIIGVVTPLDVVDDYLQQGDIFTLDWTMHVFGDTEEVAAGAFRVIHNGLTSPPNQTETMRMIPAGPIWVGDVGSCRTEFTQLELVFHHLRPEGTEIQSALASFTTTDSPGTLVGYFSGSAAMDVGTISGTFDGQTYVCDIDLHTLDIDCTVG